ncbi:Crp/Fnr family transcriptional regulator [Lewinella sp. IMCC34191]|uniref:Crp/Fnr family transcriptional regulator n=1 Tax=Lewinella sp. IMCC34191 TaxID=2259172 RepID=UPI00130025D0|nr:Crp/Fnr family transcriptional regulator [Lewinella sp. IMCC34191]
METDNHQPLKEELLKFGVPPESADIFTAGLSGKSYQAKEEMFVEGDKYPDAAFILSGYMRLYVTDAEGDITTRLLAGPGDFIGCIMATLYDREAQYTAECITDCELLIVNKSTISEAKEQVHTRAVLQDIVLHQMVKLMQERAVMLPLKATDRYLYFRKRYPEMMERIPAGILANYIGVRPQSLSRIKQMLR